MCGRSWRPCCPESGTDAHLVAAVARPDRDLVKLAVAEPGSSRACATLKGAVFAPVPSARESTATAATAPHLPIHQPAQPPDSGVKSRECLTSRGAVDSIHWETFVTRVFRSTSFLVLASMLTGLSAAGCSPLGPTSLPDNLPNSAVTIENFTGALAVRGQAFYSFTVVDGGTTYLSLISLKEGGVDSEALVTLGIGVPRGTGCTASNVLSVKATDQLHISGTTNRGVHCAVVFDPGNLTMDATFSVNIVRPS